MGLVFLWNTADSITCIELFKLFKAIDVKMP